MQGDSLVADPGERYEMVLANPPFGKKSSYTVVFDDGQVTREVETYEREDFRSTTSNKQLNFLQHIMTILKTPGSAAVTCSDRHPASSMTELGHKRKFSRGHGNVCFWR